VLLSVNNGTKFLHVTPDQKRNSYYSLRSFSSYPTITTQISALPEYEMQPIIFDMGSYNFITCHGTRIPALRVGAYFDPFDRWVWICIVLSVLLSPILGSVLLHLLHKVEFRTCYFIIMDAIAFALIIQYPRGDGKNFRSAPFRFMYRANYGVVLLACIVLVNVYMSLVITNVTSPMPLQKDYGRVEELEKSMIMVTLYENTMLRRHVERVIESRNNLKKKNNTAGSISSSYHHGEEQLKFYSNIGLSIYVTLITGDCRKYQAIFYAIWNNKATGGTVENDDMNTGKIEPFCKTLFTVLNQFATVTYPLERIGKILSSDKCSKNYFYLLTNSKIDGKLVKLVDESLQSHEHIPYYKGKSKFFPHRVGWKVSKNGPSDGGGMIRNLNAIVRSGIYHFLKELVRHRENRNIKNLTEKYNKATLGYKQHSFKYSAMTFYFYFICLGFSTLVLLSEKLIIMVSRNH
jgi:hypothetical protein